MSTNYPSSNDPTVTSPTVPPTTGFDAPTTGYDASTGSDSSVKDTAKEQARQTAGTAAEETRHVAGVAQGEAARVASEASSQVRALAGQASSHVQDQSREQLGRLVEVIRSFGDDLESMAAQSSGPVAGLVSEAAERVTALSSALEGREPADLLEDARSFARRRPGVFLGGALVAGLVAGRLTRGAKAAKDSSPSSTRSGQGFPSARGFDSSGTDTLGSGDMNDGTHGYVPAGPDGFDVRSTDPTADPLSSESGLPNPAGSVAGGTTYGDSRGLA